ncbi:hypothetical protein HDU76_005428 [Blyttiomyces sp. JEL0837]|nr:hypothetical protein HDU76_005428 [Blyttiomyces sp. JEL0837]
MINTTAGVGPANVAAGGADADFRLDSADWILIFDATTSTPTSETDRQSIITAWDTLISRLLTIGLHVKIRELPSFGASPVPGSKTTIVTTTARRLAIFIKSPDQLLARLAYKERIEDWLAGVGDPIVEPPQPSKGIRIQKDGTVPPASIAPATATAGSSFFKSIATLTPTQIKQEDEDDEDEEEEITTEYEVSLLTPADRLRLVHELITAPIYEGGAGVIAPNHDPHSTEMAVDALGTIDDAGMHGWLPGCRRITALIALNDVEFANRWIKTWSHKWLLSGDDITDIRENLGDEMAYYFAFLQFYFVSLFPLSVFGVFAYYFLPSFSSVYATALLLWCAFFLVAWGHQSQSLAQKWNTVNYAAKGRKPVRQGFTPDAFLCDSVTGERIPFFPHWKRWLTHLLMTIPSILLFVIIITFLSLLILTVEVFFNEVYTGPLKPVLSLTPIVLYVLIIPYLAKAYNSLARRLSHWENRASDRAHDSSLVYKSFIVTALLTQFSLVLVGLGFVPIADLLPVVFLQVGIPVHFVGDKTAGAGAAGKDGSVEIGMGPHTLRDRLIYFAVTAQVVQQVMEVVVPLVMQWWNLRNVKTSGNVPVDGKKNDGTGGSGSGDGGVDEIALLRRLHDEIELPAYSTYDDFAELANQFGLIVLFSVSWPLVPLVCFVNNFIELRSDAVKISKAFRRPQPRRADGIYPWSRIFTTLSFIGSLTTAAISALYHNWDPNTPPSIQSASRLPYVLAACVLSEHIFFVAIGLARVIVTAIWGHTVDGGDAASMMSGDGGDGGREGFIATQTRWMRSHQFTVVQVRKKFPTGAFDANRMSVFGALFKVFGQFLESIKLQAGLGLSGGSGSGAIPTESIQPSSPPLSELRKRRNSLVQSRRKRNPQGNGDQGVNDLALWDHRLRFDAKRRHLMAVGIDVLAGSYGGRVSWTAGERTNSTVGEDSLDGVNGNDGGSPVGSPMPHIGSPGMRRRKRMSVLEEVHPAKAVMRGLAFSAIHEVLKR